MIGTLSPATATRLEKAAIDDGFDQTDAERLDVFNGILLAPHLDAAFDRGFITLADDGTVMVRDLSDEAREVLGLNQPLRVPNLADGHCQYLPWHRENVFRGRHEVES